MNETHKEYALVPLGEKPKKKPRPPAKTKETYKVTMDPADVSAATIRRYRALHGLRDQMQGRYARPVDQITDAEVAQFVVAHWQSLKKRERKPEAIAKGIGAEAEKLYKRYVAEYTARTPNDHASLRQLASIEIALMKLGEYRIRSLEAGQVAEVARIVDAEKSLSSEHRQLQQLLGIDKSSRDAVEERKGGADYMHNLMRQAKELFATKAVLIRCAHCKTFDIELHMGHILCHFDSWIFQMPCPKCGKLIVLKP